MQQNINTRRFADLFWKIQANIDGACEVLYWCKSAKALRICYVNYSGLSLSRSPRGREISSGQRVRDKEKILVLH